MRISASCAGVAAMLFLTPAYATKMSAKITVSKEYVEALAAEESSRSAGGKDYYWKLPNAIIQESRPSVDFTNDAAVVLFKDDAPPSKPDELTTVKVHAGQMEKRAIVTRPGSAIRFLSVSPFTQELFSPDIASFEAEAQSTNSFRTIEFPTEGVFKVRSKLYPHFLAYIVVTQGKTLDVKPDGTVTEDLEPGEYTLKVFHNGKWIHKQSFAVEGGRMDPLTVTLIPGREEAADKPPAKPTEGKKDAAAGKEKKEQATAPKSEGNGN